jgi:ferredoxin
MSAVSSPPITPAQLEARIGCRLPERSADGRARSAALMADTWSGRAPTSLVAYASAGSLAIIADRETGEALAARVGDALTCTLVMPRDDEPDADEEGSTSGLRTIRAELAGVSGYLGNFGIRGRVGDEEVDIAPSLLTAHKPFDIVLDLGGPPQLGNEILPPGYYAPRDEEALERALDEIPGLVGEFEKPRYFRYDAGICAHGASGIRGCTRCIDTCPTEAITSIGEKIEVNPHLCQGAGSCATACPSGAITYAFPLAGDLLASLRTVLAAYRVSGGRDAKVLFHDGESGRAWLAQHAEALPENVIPCEVEEIGSVGMDAWFCALAYGATEVGVLLFSATPPSVRAELETQRRFAGAILDGMEHEALGIRMLEADDEASLMAALQAAPSGNAIEPAAFQPQNEKRTNIRLAVEHLYEQAVASPQTVSLPAGAPFGELRVDAESCTLCMACVGVCPTSALSDGGAEPKLGFVEWNCVQCGLCERACPEDAIERVARFVYDPRLRRDLRVLNEDAPFHCVGCGKAFATTRVIERMRDKLAGHWMFQKPEAVKRLEMCEDCRVKDMFKDGGGLLDGLDDRS